MTDDVRKAIAAALKKAVTELLGSKLDGPFSPIFYPTGYYYLIQIDANTYNANALRVIDQLCVQDTDGIISLTGSSFSAKYLEILQNVNYKTSTSDGASIKRLQGEFDQQSTAVVAAYESVFGTITQQQIDQSKCYPPKKIWYIQNIISKQYGENPQNIPQALASFMNTYAQWSTTSGNLSSFASRAISAENMLNAGKRNTATPEAANAGWQIGPSSFGAAYVGLPNQEVITAGVKADAQKLPLTLMLTDQTEDVVVARDAAMDRVGDAAIQVPLDLVSIRLGDAAVLRDAAAGPLPKVVGAGLDITASRIGMSILYPGVTVVPAIPLEISENLTTGWYSQAILSGIIRTSGKDLSGLQLREDYGSSVGELFGQGKSFARVKTFVISQEPTIQLTFFGANPDVIGKQFKKDQPVRLDVGRLLSLGASSSGLEVKRTEIIDGNTVVTLAPPEIEGVIPSASRTAHVIGGVVEFPPVGFTSSEVGVITVKNNGGFNARFSVQYLQNGKTRADETGSFSLLFAKSLQLPADASQIILKIEIETLINQWSVVATKQYPAPVMKSFQLSGTTGTPELKSV